MPGADHPETLISIGDLAAAYSDDGQTDKALRLLEKTLPKQQTILGTDHPDVLNSMNNLALVYLKAGSWNTC